MSQQALLVPFAVVAAVVLYLDPFHSFAGLRGQSAPLRPGAAIAVNVTGDVNGELCSEYAKKLEDRLQTLSKELCKTTAEFADVVATHSKRIGEVERKCKDELDKAKQLRGNETDFYAGCGPASVPVSSRAFVTDGILAGGGMPLGMLAANGVPVAVGPTEGKGAQPGATPVVPHIKLLADDAEVKKIRVDLDTYKAQVSFLKKEGNDTKVLLTAAREEARKAQADRAGLDKQLEKAKRELAEVKESLEACRREYAKEHRKADRLSDSASQLCKIVNTLGAQ